MKASDLPTRFPIPFAADATSDFIRAIPETSADPVAASLELGFPPDTFTPVGAGGTPPDGRDWNGILNQATAWSRWQGAGGPVVYDGTFQTAIGGYPKGAIVASTVTFGVYWLCTVDDNGTNPDTGGAGWTSFLALGGIGIGAQLQFGSATLIQLAPRNGGYLWINGINYGVPTSLTLSNSGLSATTLYYIYAFINSGSMALEASTTGYTLNANGIPQKTGDATRTLVGMVMTNGLGQFQFGSSNVGVVSYFCRRSIPLSGGGTSDATTTSSSLVELNAASRISFLTWADESLELTVNGTARNSSVASTTASVWLDGAAAAGGGTVTTATSASANASCAHAPKFNQFLSEGWHYISPAGSVSSGTGTFNLSAFTTVQG